MARRCQPHALVLPYGNHFKESKARLKHAKIIARDLERLLKQQEALISGTKAAA